MKVSKSVILTGIVALTVAGSVPVAYAKGSADDGTADQGKGDISLQSSTVISAGNEGGISGKSSVVTHEDGTVTITTDDDGTPDRGRGDVSVTGILDTSIQTAAGSNGANDDGTTDQGSGDVTAQSEVHADVQADINAEANVFVKVRTWLASLFGWIHF